MTVFAQTISATRMEFIPSDNDNPLMKFIDIPNVIRNREWL